MSGELTVHNLADTVRDKVRTTIVNSIPDDQIDKLVKNEWEYFFKTPETDRYSSQPAKPSPFAQMVRNEIEVKIRELVNEAVKKEMTQFNPGVWDQAGKNAVREMVKAYAPSVLEGIGAAMASECLNRINQTRNF